MWLSFSLGRRARTVWPVSVKRNVTACINPNLVKRPRAPSGVMHAPNAFVQSCDWERVTPLTLKLGPRFSDSYKKHMDLPPNFRVHIAVVSSNASILEDSPTDYFGFGKPAVTAKELFLTRFQGSEAHRFKFTPLEIRQTTEQLQFDLIKVPGQCAGFTFYCDTLVYHAALQQCST